MQIGFISSGSEQDLQFALANGIPCVEINVHNDLDKWEARKEDFKAMCDRYGVQILATGLWGRNYISPNEEERQKCFDELRRHIDLAAFWGCKVLMTGGGINEGQPVKEMARQVVQLFPKWVEYAESKGLKFCFYNCHWTNHVIGPEAWDIVLEGLPTAGIKFDPSHPFYDGLDYLAQIRDYGNRFYHLHAKGVMSVGGKRVEDPPPGMDQIDWRTFFALLYYHGYKGGIIIEPHSRTWQGELLYPGIKFAKRFLEQFVVV